MSEFSESYHLKTQNPQEAVDLLRSAGLKGYVLVPDDHGWVSFVAAEQNFKADPRIIRANPGRLLHYVAAEDHGWNFSFFEKDVLRLHYACDWDPAFKMDDSQCTKHQFEALIRDLGTGEMGDLWAELHPDDEGWQNEAYNSFAEAMGLGSFSWFAYDYVHKDHKKGPLPGVLVVE